MGLALAGRAQESCNQWVFNEDGDVLGWWQWPPLSGNRVFLPAEKIMLFRTTNKKNNPQGKSMLRGSYTSYFRKVNLERIESIGVERELAGIPMLYVDPDLLASDASADFKAILAEYKRILKNVRQDQQAALIFPAVFNETGTHRLVEFSLVNSGSRRQIDTDKIIQRYAQNIAMCILADFILIGHNAVGSFALVEQKYDMFVLSLGSIADSIATVFNKNGIRKLWEMNGFPTDRMPTMVPGELEKQDIAELSLAVQQLTASGWIKPGGLDDENFWRAMSGMAPRVEMPPQAGDPVDDTNYLAHPDMAPPDTNASQPNYTQNSGPGKPTTAQKRMLIEKFKALRAKPQMFQTKRRNW